MRLEAWLLAASNVHAGAYVVYAPADIHQIRAYAVPSHAGTALYDANDAVFVDLQLRMGGTEAYAKAVQHPGHKLLYIGEDFFRHVQGRLKVSRLHKERGTGGELFGAGQKMVFTLPGDIFDAVFPAGGKFFHQGFLFKGMALGFGYGRRQLGGFCHLENAAAAGAVRGLDDDRVVQLQAFCLLRGGHKTALAGGQSGFLKGQAHEVLVGGG